MEVLWHPISKYVVSHQTIREWLRQEYQIACDTVRQWLQKAASRVHISFDVWTSPQGYGMLGIIGHCVDGVKLENQHVLLGLRRLPQAHTGAEIGGALTSRLNFWNLSGRQVGCFVADNASVNDVAIKQVLEVLIPGIKEPLQRRGRCIGHIVNLAAKAYLFGEDVDAFEYAVETGNQSAASERLRAAQREWRKKGPIGKLLNLMVFIRASPPRRESFKRKMTGDARIDGMCHFLLLVFDIAKTFAL
jgi:hypothetical protein